MEPVDDVRMNRRDRAINAAFRSLSGGVQDCGPTSHSAQRQLVGAALRNALP
jgi:hypothetical protein